MRANTWRADFSCVVRAESFSPISAAVSGTERQSQSGTLSSRTLVTATGTPARRM